MATQTDPEHSATDGGAATRLRLTAMAVRTDSNPLPIVRPDGERRLVVDVSASRLRSAVRRLSVANVAKWVAEYVAPTPAAGALPQFYPTMGRNSDTWTGPKRQGAFLSVSVPSGVAIETQDEAR